MTAPTPKEIIDAGNKYLETINRIVVEGNDFLLVDITETQKAAQKIIDHFEGLRTQKLLHKVQSGKLTTNEKLYDWFRGEIPDSEKVNEIDHLSEVLRQMRTLQATIFKSKKPLSCWTAVTEMPKAIKECEMHILLNKRSVICDFIANCEKSRLDEIEERLRIYSE